MNVNNTDFTFHLKNQSTGSKQSFSEVEIQGLSFQNIRSFRHNFEKGITTMRSFLGEKQVCVAAVRMQAMHWGRLHACSPQKTAA